MTEFYNQASLCYGGLQINSNVVKGQLVDCITLKKTALCTQYAYGESIVFMVTIENISSCSYVNLTLYDDLGEYEYNGCVLYPLKYVDSSLRMMINGKECSPPSLLPTQGLKISGICLPAKSVVTIFYTVTVTAYAPLDISSSVTNTVTLTGQFLRRYYTDSVTITPRATTLLTITKSLCPKTVMECEDITYTFVISNAGNTDILPGDNVTVCDKFNPRINLTRVELDGVELKQYQDFNYNPLDGVFTTKQGLITPKGATFERDSCTGVITQTPGVCILVIKGSILS